MPMKDALMTGYMTAVLLQFTRMTILIAPPPLPRAPKDNLFLSSTTQRRWRGLIDDQGTRGTDLTHGNTDRGLALRGEHRAVRARCTSAHQDRDPQAQC